MSDIVVDLFAEDRAHETFLGALVKRLCAEENHSAALRVRSARGGHGRVLEEFGLYQKTMIRGRWPLPDVLVAAVDANCSTCHATRIQLESHLQPGFKGRVAFACPDPHIERWFMADPESFVVVVGAEPRREPRKCQRGRYKMLLADAIRKGGSIPTLGGIEFADGLVAAMDLFRACKNESSLKSFVDATRAILRSLSG
jgi:hypothetical protein